MLGEVLKLKKISFGLITRKGIKNVNRRSIRNDRWSHCNEISYFEAVGSLHGKSYSNI